jgi:hypothetical protein
VHAAQGDVSVLKEAALADETSKNRNTSAVLKPASEIAKTELGPENFRKSFPVIAVSQIRGFPEFSVSRSKLSNGKIRAHPSGDVVRLAKRKADALNQNMPPMLAVSSRATQKPLLLRPIKNNVASRDNGPSRPFWQ